MMREGEDERVGGEVGSATAGAGRQAQGREGWSVWRHLDGTHGEDAYLMQLVLATLVVRYVNMLEQALDQVRVCLRPVEAHELKDARCADTRRTLVSALRLAA